MIKKINITKTDHVSCSGKTVHKKECATCQHCKSINYFAKIVLCEGKRT